MFYEQQQSVRRKSSNVDKNSTEVFFKSNEISSNVSKRDVETNTDQESDLNPPNTVRKPLNSSLISIKTSKPEEEIRIHSSKKTLNVQKMPSVNIRPGFTIQPGPKINIVASNSSLYKPKRKNTEFFDIAYPSSAAASGLSERMCTTVKGDNTQYICERHVFPSGKLIAGSGASVGRDLNSPRQCVRSLQEKRMLLLDLIRSVTERIENQSGRERRNCCQLLCSLPLLASVLNSVQVDCVRCTDLLDRQMDNLIQLMKEELRSYKNLSENHCCLLDETIQYQIVELELIQDENSKEHQNPDNLKIFKHKGDYS